MPVKVTYTTPQMSVAFKIVAAILLMLLLALDFLAFRDFGMKSFFFRQFALLSICSFMLWKGHRILSKKKAQFIEFRTADFQYKVKQGSGLLKHRDIREVDIFVDEIQLLMNSGEKVVIDISDFEKYEDRVLIKQNFRKLLEV